jgi:hypothetical protein
MPILIHGTSRFHRTNLGVSLKNFGARLFSRCENLLGFIAKRYCRGALLRSHSMMAMHATLWWRRQYSNLLVTQQRFLSFQMP